jgi:hypothetical protein
MEVTLEPPFDVEGVKYTATLLFPGAAITTLGVPGVVAGTTGLDAEDGALVPTPLVAVTLK